MTNTQSLDSIETHDEGLGPGYGQNARLTVMAFKSAIVDSVVKKGSVISGLKVTQIPLNISSITPLDIPPTTLVIYLPQYTTSLNHTTQSRTLNLSLTQLFIIPYYSALYGLPFVLFCACDVRSTLPPPPTPRSWP